MIIVTMTDDAGKHFQVAHSTRSVRSVLVKLSQGALTCNCIVIVMRIDTKNVGQHLNSGTQDGFGCKSSIVQSGGNYIRFTLKQGFFLSPSKWASM